MTARGVEGTQKEETVPRGIVEAVCFVEKTTQPSEEEEEEEKKTK